MKYWINIILTIAILSNLNSFGQNSSKIVNYFGDQLVVDTTTTIIIPVLYHSSIFSSSKMEFFGDYYANILFYNFQIDSVKKLFPKNSYIVSFCENKYYKNNPLTRNLTESHIFYRVYNVDHNKNGRIDEKDPAILYISDKNGDNLIALTNENQNVVSFTIYEKNDFALVKIQRDITNDLNFDDKDIEYYYVRLNLKTMKFERKIELITQ